MHLISWNHTCGNKTHMIGQSAGEKFVKMTVYWSYFRINCVKTLLVNLKSLESLKFLLNHQRFLSWPGLANHT
jgi:hypothetical protein